MQLLIIRHAIAGSREEFARTGKPDTLRPVTPKGKDKMERAARGLRRIQPDINALAASPLTRAQETADIVAHAYGIDAFDTTDVLRPEAQPNAFETWAADRPRSGVLAVVGHEPHLSALATWLLTGDDDAALELKKGGACLLDFGGAPRRAAGELLWLLTPKQLRALAT